MKKSPSEEDRSIERYALSTSLLKEMCLEEALIQIAAAGFKHLEIMTNGVHLDPRANPDTRAVRSLMEDLGLQAYSIHTPYARMKLGHPDVDVSESQPEVIAESMEIGAEVGAKVAVIHVTAFPRMLRDDMFERSREISIAFIERLVPRAKELGITLALENLGLWPWLHRRFGTSLEQLAGEFPDPEVGFCLDVGHALRNQADLPSEIEASGSRLACLHIHSNDGVHDDHWLPTQGTLDWPKTKAELQKSGYTGRWVLEIRRGADPDSLLSQVAEFAKSDA